VCMYRQTDKQADIASRQTVRVIAVLALVGRVFSRVP
jgi:hypothetical protein